MVPKKFMKINQHELTQVGSHSPDCLTLKRAYDSCFNDWFANVFLKRKNQADETPCAPLFEAYTDCVKNALRKMDISTDDSMCPMNPKPPDPTDSESTTSFDRSSDDN